MAAEAHTTLLSALTNAQAGAAYISRAGVAVGIGIECRLILEAKHQGVQPRNLLKPSRKRRKLPIPAFKAIANT